MEETPIEIINHEIYTTEGIKILMILDNKIIFY